MAQRSQYATTIPKPPPAADVAAQIALRSEMAQTHPIRRAGETEEDEGPIAQAVAVVDVSAAGDQVSGGQDSAIQVPLAQIAAATETTVQARLAGVPEAEPPRPEMPKLEAPTPETKSVQEAVPHAAPQPESASRQEPVARDLAEDEADYDGLADEATVEIVKDAGRRAIASPAAAIVADRFAVRFLAPQSLDKYLTFAASNDDHRDYLVASHVAGFRADADNVPLELCEYLAYKSVLAYEQDEAAISQHFDRCGWRGITRGSLEFFDTKKNSDTQGFGYVSGDTAFIVMRGTTSATDWRTDLTMGVTTDDDLSAEDRAIIGNPEPRRHLGFARAWGHAAKDIEDWLVNTAQKKHGAKHLCFSGHSLGGALALVGAHDFAKRKVATADAVITYAAPKVGGKKFRDEYTALGLSERTLRCESPEDLVTYGSTHADFTNPGVSCPVDKRPMIAGMELFWAGLLGIAGWERVKEAAQKSEAEKSEANRIEAEKKEAEKEEAAAAKAAQEKPANAADQKGAPQAAAKDATKTDAAGKPAETQPETGKTSGPGIAGGIAMIVGVVVLAIVVLVGRRIVIRYRAHGAAKRYTLFFSTHTYRKIRNARFPDITKATDAELAAAAADFSKHLNFTRGPDLDHVPSFKELRNFPVLALTQKDVQWYLDKTRDSEGEQGGYWRYIW